MGWDTIGAEFAGCREPAKHRKQRKARSAAKTVLRTAAALLQGHHGSSVPAPVAELIGMGKGTGKGSSSSSWQGQSAPKDWCCKWCLGSDGAKYRNNGDRKSCRMCNISKSYSYHFQPGQAPGKPTTSLAERQQLAEKVDNRKQLVAQKKRIEHLERQLSAKAAGGSEEDSGAAGWAEGVNPSKLAARQQKTQKLLAEAQAEGLLGACDIASMPWTKVVLPKVVETAEGLHKEAKGKYSSAWSRWKRTSLLVEEQRVQVASLEEQVEAAKALLLKNEEDYKAADAALSEAAKLVELAAAKQRQEMAEKTELPAEKDEEMGASSQASGRKKASPGAKEEALLAGFQEELLADVRSGLGEPPTEEASQGFVAKCAALFLNLQKVVAEQRAAAAVAASAPPPAAAEPRGRARSRSRSPCREKRSASCPPGEADCL